MKNKIILLVSTMLLAVTAFSQIEFEPGYLIDNNNQRIECLIKNKGWRYNPKEIQYKISENDLSQTATIDEIAEFAFDKDAKFVRAEVEIDRSSNILSSLSKDREPDFSKETLFLKVQVEGNISLYAYEDHTVRRFFIKDANGQIEQLIYKRYMPKDNQLMVNKRYQQQLLLTLMSQGLTASQLERVDYNQSDLVRLFTRLQQSQTGRATNFVAKEKRDSFNFRIKIAANNSSLTVKNDLDDETNVDFGSKINASLGFEAEYVMPFKKGKWSIFSEPAFSHFDSQKTITITSPSESILNADISFKSIDIPIGLRYYFLLDPQSKIFVNIAYVVASINMDSKMTYRSQDNELVTRRNNSPAHNLVSGAGYSYKHVSVEINYSSRNISNNYIYWQSDLKTIGLKLAYQLF
ncbi:outer membrane beta-barrel protein [Mangrovibacterium lignilyticum]|uniref:outer membrane beta-barrel protein n=1 Tax=Mangrovibacterium lignilyticum TaxID=2668052 RepID=UPI0013D7EFDC|nr:outer membrane beta-barrel protein [Mangrovibacterium lignilyticum]